MSPTGHRIPHWSRREVLDLLSYLNNDIDHIRGLLQADREGGIRSACEELSKALGEGFTTTRVQNKILSLWKKRSSDDSENVIDIYFMGAYTRTLPYLDEIYPGMLDDIAANVKLMQSQAAASKEIKDGAAETSSALRRSHRRTKEDEDEDPIVCLCGFSHYASSCVHCQHCHSWQHVWCQYRTDDTKKAPPDHLCLVCEEVQRGEEANTTRNDASVPQQEGDLAHLLSQLQTESPMMRYSYAGLEDDKIAEYKRKIAFRICTVANAISTSKLDPEVLSKEFFRENCQLAELFDTCIGSDHYQQAYDLLIAQCSDSKLTVDLVKALITAANVYWVFSEGEASRSMEAMHLEMYQVVLCSKHGPEPLKSLHQAAMDLLNNDYDDRLQEQLRAEAGRMRRRLVPLLALLIPPDHDSRPAYPMETPGKSFRAKKRTWDILEETFLMSLHLKAELPTTENYFEIFYPMSGHSFDQRYMQLEGWGPDDDTILEGCSVELCVASGVIEYPMKIFKSKNDHSQLPLGSRSFISMTEEQRAKGRVIVRASVRLRRL